MKKVRISKINLCKGCQRSGKCFFEKNDLVCKKLLDKMENKGQASIFGIVGLVYLGFMLVVLLTIF